MLKDFLGVLRGEKVFYDFVVISLLLLVFNGRCDMREFRCASLGNNCTWKHIATEALLADMTALHLRDVHGVAEISPEFLARINSLFTYPTEADAAGAMDAVMKEYNCDMGPECTWRYIAMTEDLIAEGAAVHARERHGIKDFSHEMINKVKRSIHKWTGEKEEKKAAA